MYFKNGYIFGGFFWIFFIVKISLLVAVSRSQWILIPREELSYLSAYWSIESRMKLKQLIAGRISWSHFCFLGSEAIGSWQTASAVPPTVRNTAALDRRAQLPHTSLAREFHHPPEIAFVSLELSLQTACVKQYFRASQQFDEDPAGACWFCTGHWLRQLNTGHEYCHTRTGTTVSKVSSMFKIDFLMFPTFLWDRRKGCSS